MRAHRSTFTILAMGLWLWASAPGAAGEILLGIEYAMPGPAAEFAAMGLPAVKFYPDEITWGKMQSGPDRPIDFSRWDRLVREYQAAGFRELVIVLKSHSPWASKQLPRGLFPKPDHSDLNLVPKPEYMRHYAAWVEALVERYDADGRDDLPGLKFPVRYYEVGSEFSTFEPEPTPEYLTMLATAYRAAHAASDKVQVAHAAFLTTTALRDSPRPADYEAAFAAAEQRTQGRIFHKRLADIRAVLDRPDLFDLINFRALGDPYEIELTAAWLRYEMQKRRYEKPLIITDTAPTPFIAWGPATRATGPASQLGVIVPPAVEADRPRLAAYFTKLVDGDRPTLAWTHAFIAADMVKKAVVAADQQVVLINASFMEDLFPFQAKLLQAGAGTSAWGGMAEVKLNFLDQSRTVISRRPSFHALKQLQNHIRGYTTVEREKLNDARLRVYKFMVAGTPRWVAWYEAERLLLPGEAPSEKTIFLSAPMGRAVALERLITAAGVTTAERASAPVTAGRFSLSLSPTPVLVALEK